jgi:hypothetical protein
MEKEGRAKNIEGMTFRQNGIGYQTLYEQPTGSTMQERSCETKHAWDHWQMTVTRNES